MGEKIENKERKSVGLKRKKREGEGSYPRRCSKGCSRRCSKEVFKGDVQRGCSKEVFKEGVQRRCSFFIG